MVEIKSRAERLPMARSKEITNSVLNDGISPPGVLRRGSAIAAAIRRHRIRSRKIAPVRGFNNVAAANSRQLKRLKTSYGERILYKIVGQGDRKMVIFMTKRNGERLSSAKMVSADITFKKALDRFPS